MKKGASPDKPAGRQISSGAFFRVRGHPPSATPVGVTGEEPIIDLHSDAWFMGQALREARKAHAAGEVPVGAVVVHEGRIIARAWNQVETLKDATAHAEMLALTAAQQALGDWRLEHCTLYVTKEPCPMCAGAIVHCRPERVVFGCPDPKGGAAGGWINLLEANPPLNHRCDITSGVLGGECLALLQGFFREAREKKKTGRENDAPESPI
jgi:tRNA(adenine34) deaminase